WMPFWANRPGRMTTSTSPCSTSMCRSCATSLPAVVTATGTWECNFVLADDHGRKVDVHSYALDEAGNNVYGVAYIAEHLTGRGSIHSYPVGCISPEWLVRFHSGYELDENDFHDVRFLCERFGIGMPHEFLRFTRSQTRFLTTRWPVRRRRNAWA